MEEIKVGVVTHYYNHLGVGIIKLERDGLKVGDTIHIKGHTTDIQHTIESMEIEHKKVETAKPGDMIGIRFNEHVREHDDVLKLAS